MALKNIKIRSAFHEFMQTDKMLGKALSTQRNYRRVFEAFERQLGGQFNADDLRVSHINAIMKDLREGGAQPGEYRIGKAPRRGRSDISLNNDRAIIRTFVNFLYDYQYLKRGHDVLRNLENVSVPPGSNMPDIREAILTEEQAMKVLTIAGETHPRDRCAIALGLFAFMRQSEVLDLRVKNINWDENYIRFWRRKLRGKRGEWHTVPMSPVLRSELERWLTIMEERNGPLKPNWYVVPHRVRSPGGRRVGDRIQSDWPVEPNERWANFTRYMKDQHFFERAGAVDIWKAGAHTLRRTGLCWVQAETSDIRKTMQAAGHTAQSTTEVYIQHDKYRDAIRGVMDTFNPLGMDLPQQREPDEDHSNVSSLDAYRRRKTG